MKKKSLPSNAIFIALFTILIALPCFGQTGIKVLAFPVEPFAIDANGKATGYAIDLMAKIIKTSGLDLPPTEMQPLARVAAAMDAGNAILAVVGRTPERDPKYQWVAEIFTESFSFATKAGDPILNSFEDAKTAGTILAVRNGAPDTVLRASGVTKIENIATNAEGLQMLLAGRGNAWFSGTAAIKHMIATTSGAASKVGLGKALKPVGVWIAASKDIPADVIKKLQAAFKTLKDNGEYDKIFAPLK
jgi:polar amino acid transport system substrate-binding protein